MTIFKATKNETKNCPSCQNLSIQKFHPFCSSRCAQIDLSKWLNEDYRIPIIESDELSNSDICDEDDSF